MRRGSRCIDAPHRSVEGAASGCLLRIRSSAWAPVAAASLATGDCARPIDVAASSSADEQRVLAAEDADVAAEVAHDVAALLVDLRPARWEWRTLTLHLQDRTAK